MSWRHLPTSKILRRLDEAERRGLPDYRPWQRETDLFWAGWFMGAIGVACFAAAAVGAVQKVLRR